MFQISEFTEARLSTLTPRSERHGEDEKPAVSLGLELTVGNELLDSIDKDLAPRLFKHPTTKALPGVRDALTVLACNSIERVLLPTKHEGWTLQVDADIDDSKPLTFGTCKVDKFSVEPKQGGSVVLRLRVGTSDLDAARSGMLGMHVGQPIWITLVPPKPGEEKKADAKGKAPDATDLFAGQGEPAKVETKATLSPEAAWPFPTRERPDKTPPPQSVTVETSRPGTRTARGLEKTKAALAAGAPKLPMKYVDKATGSTWSGRGLQPKWLKVALERGKKLSDFEVRA